MTYSHNTRARGIAVAPCFSQIIVEFLHDSFNPTTPAMVRAANNPSESAINSLKVIIPRFSMDVTGAAKKVMTAAWA